MSVSLLYQAIKTKIETDVTEIEHVRLFNNQFTNETQESAFQFPVCFIEFSTINYEDDSQGNQKALIEMTLHIGFKSFKDEDVSFWDITNKIYSVLQGYAVNSGGTTFEPLKRLREVQDIEHNMVFVWQQVYSVELIDQCAFVGKDLVAVEPFTVQIDAKLDIDNINIRTGDGVFE